MNQNDFLVAIEQELRLRGARFRRADLLDFVAAAWPLVEDDTPDAGYFWASEFLAARHALVG